MLFYSEKVRLMVITTLPEVQRLDKAPEVNFMGLVAYTKNNFDSVPEQSVYLLFEVGVFRPVDKLR